MLCIWKNVIRFEIKESIENIFSTRVRILYILYTYYLVLLFTNILHSWFTQRSNVTRGGFRSAELRLSKCLSVSVEARVNTQSLTDVSRVRFVNSEPLVKPQAESLLYTHYIFVNL